jgi:His-Xaa-Ser system protein HxsD
VEPICSPEFCLCSVDTKVYPLEAAMKAAYAFVDYCYVFLFYDEGVLRVRIKPKPQSPRNSSTLADEYLNELLNQNIRYRLTQKTRSLRELIMGRALYPVCLETECPAGPSSKDEQTAEADALGIGNDWFGQDGGTGDT